MLKVCAVRDRAIDAFGRPFFVRALGEAIRGFSDEINNDQSAMKPHPDDYDLYHIGEYDDSVGLLLPLDKPKQIAIGKEMVSVVSVPF